MRMRTQDRRVGLISDTHGLLRSEAADALRGVDFIIHAGDICDPGVLDALARIAPLTAVRGNNDRGEWAERLPVTATLRVGDANILVVHDLATLAGEAQSLGARVVVAGHSHRPLVETRAGVLYVNPGSAGPRRFRLPISIGYLFVGSRGIRAELRELEVDGVRS